MRTRVMRSGNDRDAGFTVVELVVVLVIVGILVAVAVPVFISQRAAARNASIESDIRTVAALLETYYRANNAYPAAAADLVDAGARVSSGNYVAVAVNADGSYEITGCNLDEGAGYAYDSELGGFVDATGATCPPGAAVDTIMLR